MMMEDDDDEVLAWKTLEDHDEHTGEHHHHHHHSHHHSVDHVHAHGGGIPSGTDDDVEDFAELAYEHERTSTTTVVAAGDAHPPHSLLQLQQHERHASHSHHHHHHSHRHGQQRLKRKNFSKQLQLFCLQRYAQYAKEHGKLPDKTECQLLLNQSYLQFLKDGGAPDEPRLTHQEFLKLIRNRRREMYVRAQKLKFPHVSSSSSNASTVITISGDTGASNEVAAGGITSQPLSAAKRKLQQEHTKIYELIEIIDQAREQSGLVSGHNHNRQSVRVPQSSQSSEKRRVSTKSTPLQQQQSTAHEHQQHHQHHQHQQQQQQLVAYPQDQIRAIFRIQQETLEIQREITERLKVIRLHRSLRQHDPMEPSSASV